jgi:hypothetical protein
MPIIDISNETYNAIESVRQAQVDVASFAQSPEPIDQYAGGVFSDQAPAGVFSTQLGQYVPKVLTFWAYA